MILKKKYSYTETLKRDKHQENLVLYTLKKSKHMNSEHMQNKNYRNMNIYCKKILIQISKKCKQILKKSTQNIKDQLL